MNNIIYIAVVGAKSSAGDAFLSAVFLKEPLTNEVLLQPREFGEVYYPSYYFEGVQEIKDLIISEVASINCNEIKLNGIKICVREKIDNLVAAVCLKSEVINPVVLIADKAIPNPTQYEVKRVKTNYELKLAYAIAFLHFRAKMRYYSQTEKYKKYRFEWHLGTKTRYHMQMVFKYGLSDIHRESAFKNSALWLYNSISRGHKTVKPYAKYLKDSPPWWKSTYKDLSFTDSLTEEQRQSLDGLLYNYLGYPYKTSTPYPEKMSRWVDENKIPGLLDLEDL